MVTAHFYDEDSVKAQLIYSLIQGDETDAHAAASELAATDTRMLYKTLCFAWWLSPYDHPLQSVRAAAFLAQDAHALYSALISSPFLLPSITLDVKPAGAAAPATLLEIQKAIKKRQTDRVYAAAAAADTSLLAAFIPAPFLAEMKNTIYKPLEQRILAHACAYLTAYRATAPAAPPWTVSPRGAISGRTFKISEAALALWQIRSPLASELRGDPYKLIQQPLFETEEDEIVFFRSAFPDDIPDEWSDLEIAKSHAFAKQSATIERNVWRTAFLDLFD